MGTAAEVLEENEIVVITPVTFDEAEALTKDAEPRRRDSGYYRLITLWAEDVLTPDQAKKTIQIFKAGFKAGHLFRGEIFRDLVNRAQTLRNHLPCAGP